MGTPSKIDLQLDETFPHLLHAPITEAVVEIRAEAEVPWEEQDLGPKLRTALPDYPRIQSVRGIRQAFFMGPGQPPHQTVSDLGWRGLEFRASDGLAVAGFYRDSFIFSRLQPYPKWEWFLEETLRLWEIHCGLARPSVLRRAGLRFINQVLVEPEGLRLGDYLCSPPRTTDGLELPFNFFFHHDNASVPGHPYGLNIIRALQPRQELGGGQTTPAKLILDIDVGTTASLPLGGLKQCLVEMRWLKNKAFFGNFTGTAINSFR